MYKQNLIEASQINAKKESSKLAFDKTIEAEIFSILDKNTGIYKIRYQNAIMTAYSKDLKKQYAIGEQVFVKIIGGDFSNQKIIESQVQGESLSDSQKTELENSFFPISDNLLIINNEFLPLKTKAGYDGVLMNDEDTLFDLQLNQDFFWYDNHYKYLELRADFQTLFTKDFQEYGKYGLEIKGHTKIKDPSNNEEFQTFTYIFDTDDFNGKIYQFNSMTAQSIIIPITPNLIKDITSIKLFQKGFILSSKNNNNSFSNFDILATNISLRFMEKKDLTVDPFFVRILAPNGHYFTKDKKTLKLQCDFREKGEKILPEKIFWFKKNVNIQSPEDVLYNKDGGIGWECIDSYTSKEEIIINSNEVIKQQEYKIIIFYKDNKYSATTGIEKSDSKYYVKIDQQQNGSKTYLNLTVTDNSGVLQNIAQARWSMLTPSGIVLIKDDILKENQKKSSIEISTILEYSSNVFYCDIFINDNGEKKYLCFETYYYLITSEKDDKYQVNFSGRDVFKYDANGNLPLKEIGKKYSINFSLIPLQENFNPASIKYTWFLNPTPKDLLSDKNQFNFNTSLFSSLNIGSTVVGDPHIQDQNISLDFTIKKQYNINMSKTILYVKIFNIETQQTDFYSKEILFLKDGDLGTNGTSYSVQIVPWDNINDIIASHNFYLKYNSKGVPINEKQKYYYKAIVYDENGNEITENVKYRWSCGEDFKLYTNVNTEVEEKLVEGQSIIEVRGRELSYIKNEIGNHFAYQLYLKVQVKLPSNLYINNILTIPILKTNFQGEKIYNTNNLTINFPKKIQYNASGESPYYQDYLLAMENLIPIENNQITANTLPNKYIEVFLDSQNNQRLKVIPKFYPQIVDIYLNDRKKKIPNNIATINIILNKDESIIYPIILYLNTYGNENINIWDGTSIKINEEDQYILAPQIGAGEKDDLNRFSGVILGKNTGFSSSPTGLFGINKGKVSFGFCQDGSAFIGKEGGGQILFNEKNPGIIQSASFDTGEAGTKINLSEGTLELKGKTNLYYIEAQKVNEKNYQEYYIYNEQENKYQKPSQFDNKKIYYQEKKDFQTISLNSKADSIPLSIGTKFSVDWEGNVKASGEIKATSGKIGQWLIGENGSLKTENNNVILDPYGQNILHVGENFNVDSDGNLTVKGNITLQGNITWSSESNPVKILYHQDIPDGQILNKPNKNYESYLSQNLTDWHKTFVSGDIYGSYSYEGGTSTSWGDPIRVVGQNGSNGLDGHDGNNGLDGKNGNYTHVAYAMNSTGSEGFSTTNSQGKQYLGICVNTEIEDPGADRYREYTWTLIKGADGKNGLPGGKGADGKTYYLHIAYADSSDGSLNFNNGNPGGATYLYMGQYTDTTKADSYTYSDYSWSKIKGSDGQNGKSVKVLYHRPLSNGNPPGSRPQYSYNSYYSSSSTDWHQTFNSTYDMYASYSNLDGVSGSWGEIVQIVGKDGKDEADIKQVLLNDYAIDLRKIDSTKVTKAKIESPQIEAARIGASSIIGGEIYGSKIYAADSYKEDSYGNVSPPTYGKWLEIESDGLHFKSNGQESFYITVSDTGSLLLNSAEGGISFSCIYGVSISSTRSIVLQNYGGGDNIYGTYSERPDYASTGQLYFEY